MILRFLLPLLLAAATASAAPFAPELLRISAPSVVDYDFSGDGIYIPFDVTGPEAEVIFSIFTKDHRSAIRNVRNGYLGWHYVDGVDTCVYVSPPRRFPVGRHVIAWEGKNNDGHIVPAGEYTYYLWGYDPATPPKIAARHVSFNGAGTVRMFDGDGIPIPNPVLYPSAGSGTPTRSRWVIGSDPEDASLLETTLLPDTGGTGTLLFDGRAPGRFFTAAELPGGYTAVRGYAWTPNGTAVPAAEWGNGGSVLLDSGPDPNPACPNPGLVDPYRMLEPRFHTVASGIVDGKRRTALYSISTENGAVARTDDLSAWWVTPEGESAGPTTLAAHNGVIALGSDRSCLHMMVDPGEYEDQYSEWYYHPFVRYANGYGDGVGEIVSDTTPRPWACLDPESPPHARTVALNANQFATFLADGLSGTSFGLLSPDGTGLGYFAFAGETGTTSRGHLVIDYGSAYDGFHIADSDSGGVWFVGQDCFKGIITTIGNYEYIPHFRTVWNHSGGSAEIVLDTEVFFTQPGGLFSFGDEVGVFTPSGICAGSARPMHFNRYFSIRVHADDPATPEIEGMREGEAFTFRFWDYESQQEYPLTAVYESAETVYRDNARIVVKSLVPDIVSGVGDAAPRTFSLRPNTPNPFNPSTTLSFTLPSPGNVSLTVYDVTGRKVTELAHGFHASGEHSAIWNAKDCASGVYFAVLKAGERTETRKMLLVR